MQKNALQLNTWQQLPQSHFQPIAGGFAAAATVRNTGSDCAFSYGLNTQAGHIAIATQGAYGIAPNSCNFLKLSPSTHISESTHI